MIKPIGARVLVERVKAEEKTAGGLFLPEQAQEKPQKAVVKALGTGGRDKDGNLLPFNVKEGDTVLVSKYGGVDLEHEGNTFLLIAESDILAIIE